ncbi:MAG: hypothetical protein E7664_02975 [Ruminococcaceae bacterium]|nr:hypothetical protein [Oscillospiraceae bacterium]
MAKKQSGLGRGLGDLLEDNKPEIRSSSRVVIREDKKDAPKASVGLYDGLSGHKNRSVKANFRQNTTKK